MDLNEFVFELYGEEIPARFQLSAQAQFHDLFIKMSGEKGLKVENTRTYITPQRLILRACVSAEIPAQTINKRGPRLDAPLKAIEGFCKSIHVPPEQLEKREGYYYVTYTIPAEDAKDILPGVMNETLLAMSWPKTMRWPKSPTPWVRPVHHAFAILLGKPFIFSLPLFNLKTTDHIFGHRFLAPKALFPSSFSDYKNQLIDSFVVIDHKERQALIHEKLKKEAESHQLTLIDDQKLLEETAGLVEYPGIFIGRLDPKLFGAPEEAITTSMRFHQKCFAFRDPTQKLAPFFAAIINTIPKDGGKALTQGYEMGMLKARLEDARFFYEQDLKTPLIAYKPKLDGIIFHEKLGTVGDKLKRLHHMASIFSSTKDYLNLSRAIDLCKSDLLTHMVGEFAELQGIMGEIYARQQGETEDVSRALREYYQPTGAGDNVPIAFLSVTLGLLDKIDTLTGFVGHGILPTGSKDPFALRRTALGILRLLFNQGEETDLTKLITLSMEAYALHHRPLKEDTLNNILSFMQTRLVFLLKEEGFPHDVIQACLPTLDKGLSFDCAMIRAKTEAFTVLLKAQEGKDLISGFKRACSIVDTESKKDNVTEYTFSIQDLVLKSEIGLYAHLEKVQRYLTDLPLTQKNLSKWFSELASFVQPIYTFFEDVIVNDPDPILRRNRLGLLSQVIALYQSLADFRKIE